MKTDCKWLLLAARGAETIHEDMVMLFLTNRNSGCGKKILFLPFSIFSDGGEKKVRKEVKMESLTNEHLCLHSRTHTHIH